MGVTTKRQQFGIKQPFYRLTNGLIFTKLSEMDSLTSNRVHISTKNSLNYDVKYTLQRAARSSLFWYFFALLQFFAFFGCPLTRNGIPKWIFLWHKSEACQGVKRHKRSAAQVIALRSYDSIPQICILRNGFLSGERNSLLDFPFAWMLN